jgi:hypothetical protein
MVTNMSDSTLTPGSQHVQVTGASIESTQVASPHLASLLAVYDIP